MNDFNHMFKIDSKIFEGGIIELETKDLMGKVTREILNTKEKAVRDSLIALGWTPPEDKSPN